MQISPTEEYALRCAVQLAREDAGARLPLSASKIAEREGISPEYVSKILHLFRKAGIVEATRGASGGFRLSAHPAQMPLKRVFDALESRKRVDQDFCKNYAGKASSCVHLNGCAVRPVWQVLGLFFDDLLSQVTLADLLNPEPLIHARLKRITTPKESKVPHEAYPAPL